MWLALLAAVIGTTFAYHLLNYSSPFGEFDTLRLRRSTQAANQVKTFVVESRAPVLLHQPCCPSHQAAFCPGCHSLALQHSRPSACSPGPVHPKRVLAAAAAVAANPEAGQRAA